VVAVSAATVALLDPLCLVVMRWSWQSLATKPPSSKIWRVKWWNIRCSANRGWHSRVTTPGRRVLPDTVRGPDAASTRTISDLRFCPGRSLEEEEEAEREDGEVACADADAASITTAAAIM
jgi:hypothetical protein